MAALHEALKSLSPADFTSIPTDNLSSFLSDIFADAETVIDSVPPPAENTNSSNSTPGRSRAASNASEISSSSARSPPAPANIEALQKEWGKPIKLKPSENPLGISVYKASGKDGKGAWFARRSVHEGLGFQKFKIGLEREFPESLKVKGPPGEGNIRGIGGERRVEHKYVKGVGTLDVYHLSAQFPGPTTPRDFVTLLLSSDSALTNDIENSPRHFMVVSKPCNHPDCPPREGFIRGFYESVEIIREIPINNPRRSMSTTNLPSQGHSRQRSSTSSLTKEAVLRNAQKSHHDPTIEEEVEARKRGKTISFAESRGSEAKGEKVDTASENADTEANPVEWIMITRSDPGGSVPRFMVERGTPGSIVADASKFLDWACANDLDEMEEDDEDAAETASLNGSVRSAHHNRPHDHEHDLHDYQTNGHLAGVESTSSSEKQGPAEGPAEEDPNSVGFYGMVVDAATAAGSIVAAHTPTIIANHLPGSSETTTTTTTGTTRRASISSTLSSDSDASFTSATEGLSTSDSHTHSASSPSVSSRARADSAAAQLSLDSKYDEKKRKADAKLAKTREKELAKANGNGNTNANGDTDPSEKEAAVLAKARERHERELKKQEEKYRKEVKKLEDKRVKAEKKEADRRLKEAEKEDKARLLKELEGLRAEVRVLRTEKEELIHRVEGLVRENSTLVGRLGSGEIV